MQYWDEVLFPHILATIRGERYLIMTEAQINEELVNLIKRAIATFKFPNVSLAYDKEVQADIEEEAQADIEEEPQPDRYYFNSDEVGYREIDILVAWTKAFWAEMIVSNADNFTNLYFDSNIKTFSPGNTLNNYQKMWESYTKLARELERDYYRVDTNGKPTFGSITEDE